MCQPPPFSWDPRELPPPKQGTAAGGTEQGEGLGDPALQHSLLRAGS